jgi:ubiquinone/menaquinone biosynthesis C-methylase UbiE/DNA-binding transcriptional ArsR family regulator
MGSSIDALVNQLKAAGDETRLRLLALLQQGERTVKELTEILGQSQPRVSRHLKVLTEAGLVSRSPEGSWVYYRLAEEPAGRDAALGILRGLHPIDATLRRDNERLAALKRQNREAAERYFAEHASRWDEIRSLHVPEREVEAAMLARAGAGPFQAMLDVGTGTGRMLELFASRYERALGIDLSPAMLAVARANLERAAIDHARVRLGDVMHLPVLRDSFDLVVIHQVLHFLDEPGRAVVEAAGALCAGGRMLIVDFAPHELEHLRQSQAHRRLGFAHAQMQQWVEAAGLDLEAVEDLAPSGPGGLTVTIWTAVDRRLARTAQGIGAEARP